MGPPILPTADGSGLADGLLFALMIGANVYVLYRLLPRAPRAATLADVVFVLGILVMALGLWTALAFAFLDPGDASTTSVFIAVNSMMAVVGVWVISLFLRAEEHPIRSGGLRWPAWVAGLLTGNEILMGTAFILQGAGWAPYGKLGAVGWAALLADAATSSWFYWAMLANMIPLIIWTRLARAEREALLGFAVAAAVGPFVLGSPVAAALGMALIMAVGFALLWRHLRRGEFTDSYARTAAVVWVGFLLMAAGAAASFLLPLAPGLRGIPFAAAGTVVMLGEAFFLLRRGIGRSDGPPIGSPTTAPSSREETSTGSLAGG